MKGTAKDCATVIKESADFLTPDQARELRDRIRKQVETRLAQKAAGKIDDIEFKFATDKAAISDEVVIAALKKKKNAAINTVVRNRLKEYLKNFDDPSKGFMAKMVGGIGTEKGIRDSTDYKGIAIMVDALAEIADRLDAIKTPDGVNATKGFFKGLYDLNVAKEKFHISDPNWDGKPLTDDKVSFEIAKAIDDVQKKLVDRLNRGGADIRIVRGYIVRNTHDMYKLRTAGKEAWKAAVGPLLDENLTFLNVNPVERGAFLDAVYDDLASGEHMKFDAEQDQDSNTFDFSETSNLANKLSKHRVLHFKDGESWFNYNKMFGTKTLSESIYQGIERSSRSAALLEDWGTNPEAMFKRTLNEVAGENIGKFKIRDRLRNVALQNAFANIDGTTRIPVNPRLAKFFGTVRTIQSMAKLGFSGIYSATTDIATAAAGLRIKGVPLMESYSRLYANLLVGATDAEAKRLNRATVAAMDGQLGILRSRFFEHDPGVPGWLASLNAKFFQWNGVNFLNDMNRGKVGAMMAEILGRDAHLGYDKIAPETQRLFRQYDIKPHEWEAIRSSVFESEEYPGIKYVTADSIDNIPREIIERMVETSGAKKISPSNTARGYDRLRTVMRQMFVDQSQMDIPMPGAAQGVYTNFGTRPGTIHGELLRTLVQFKQFPFTIWTKGAMRHLFGVGGLKSASSLFGLAHYAFSSIAMGYIAMTAFDLFRGVKPRPINGKTLFAAAQKGGGLGIYGDFLFGQYNHYNQSVAGTLLGPTFGQVDNINDIKQRLFEGDLGKAGVSTVNLVKNNTPFINLLWTKAALDYLILYQLQEAINPGYLSRMENRLQQEREQEYWLPNPSRVVPYGGGEHPLIPGSNLVD